MGPGESDGRPDPVGGGLLLRYLGLHEGGFTALRCEPGKGRAQLAWLLLVSRRVRLTGIAAAC